MLVAFHATPGTGTTDADKLALPASMAQTTPQPAHPTGRARRENSA